MIEPAIREGMAPLLYGILRDQAPLPADLEAGLRRAYMRNASRNMLLLHDLEVLLARFNDAGISVIVLKGAALLDTTYGGTLALRSMADMDLLIDQAALPAAQKILAGHEYAPGLEMPACISPGGR